MPPQTKTTKNAKKSPGLYSLLLLIFVYIFVLILGFQHGESLNPIIGGMYFVEFGVHEASHLIVMFLPSIIVAAAGSIGEILFPVLIVIAAIKGRAQFAMIFGLLWLCLSLKSVGLYMADAQTMNIPLVGPGENVQHDWNYVFSQLGWLDASPAIGGAVQVLGVIVGALALGYGLLVVVSYYVDHQTDK